MKGTSKYVDVANDNKNVQIVKNVNIPPKQLKNQYVSSLSKCQFNYKFILVGNSSVGKTSLTTRCVFNEFNENSANSRVCQVVSMPPYNIEGTQDWAQVQIWDTLGQEKFHSLAPLFFRRAVGAFLVYDVSDRESFDSLDLWH